MGGGGAGGLKCGRVQGWYILRIHIIEMNYELTSLESSNTTICAGLRATARKAYFTLGSPVEGFSTCPTFAVGVRYWRLLDVHPCFVRSFSNA